MGADAWCTGKWSRKNVYTEVKSTSDEIAAVIITIQVCLDDFVQVRGTFSDGFKKRGLVAFHRVFRRRRIPCEFPAEAL